MLTDALARHLGFQQALETVAADRNPYLAKFYEEGGKERYALPLQLFFLEDRVAALREMHRRGGNWVADQLLYTDAEIFARGHRNAGYISEEGWQEYERRYKATLTAPDIPQPDLMIYLHAPLESVLERISIRGRESERDTDPTYWVELHSRYERWIRSFDHCPVLRVDARSYDLIGDPGSLEPIAARVEREIGPRRPAKAAQGRR
jgi:deoxyadenosine/deoxycytidine kinase